jgi:hypothetical protein
MITLYNYLKAAFEITGEDFGKMVTTLTEEELHEDISGIFREYGGIAFSAWGEKYAYFPILGEVDGSIGWIPRNPCAEAASDQCAVSMAKGREEDRKRGWVDA